MGWLQALLPRRRPHTSWVTPWWHGHPVGLGSGGGCWVSRHAPASCRTKKNASKRTARATTLHQPYKPLDDPTTSRAPRRAPPAPLSGQRAARLRPLGCTRSSLLQQESQKPWKLLVSAKPKLSCVHSIKFSCFKLAFFGSTLPATS